MKAQTRRKLEMGKRALDFSRAHPEATPGYTAALSRLEGLLTRAESLATQQRDGIGATRSATERKRELRRTMVRSHLRHLTEVARVAAAEAPDLPQKFLLRGASTYFAFRTAARSMAAEAAANKEVLEKNGLSETVLGGLTQALDQFDVAMDQSASGRQALRSTPGGGCPAGERGRQRRAGSRGGRGGAGGEGDGRAQPRPVRHRQRPARRVGERAERGRLAASRGRADADGAGAGAGEAGGVKYLMVVQA